MASYNHTQHAAGGWNNNISASVEDMSIDPMERKHNTKKRQGPKGCSNPYMPPPQTTTLQPHSVTISEGGWNGLMTIPRAVSHDQSDETEMEMDISQANDDAGSSQRSQSTMDYTASIPPSDSTLQNTRSPTTGNAVDATTPTSVSRPVEEADGEQQWNNLSPLTNNDQSSTTTTSSSSFVVGRYDCVEEDAVNGTAYFSASGLSSAASTSTTSQETPRPLETSIAISLSPSPVRQPDIYDVTSLTRMDNEDELQHLSEIQEEDSVEVAVGKNNEQATLESNNNESESQHPTLLSVGNPSNASSSSLLQSAARTQDIFVARRPTNREQPSSSSDLISIWRSKSHDGTSTHSSLLSETNINTMNLHPSASSGSQLSSIRQELSKSNSTGATSLPPPTLTMEQQPKVETAITTTQSQNDFALWREKSILDDTSAHSVDDNDNIGIKEDQDQQEATQEPPASLGSTNSEETNNFGLSTQLMAPSVPDQERDPTLESFHKDPLFELHELSNAQGTDQKEPSMRYSPPNTPSANSTANLSLGHYLSSCSSGSPKAESQAMESVKEPLMEDGTILSDINVSKWSVNSPEMSKTNPAEEVEQAPRSTPKMETAPRTPQKLDFVLNPKEFNSPATTLRKNSLGISLEESTSYLNQIEQLQEELAGAKRALKEQKTFYDDQIAEQHKFTLPLHAYSPYNPATHQKHSPGTQQQRLLERNQTLLKEVRFADQTCVELSEQNAALQKQLHDREDELGHLRRDHQELKLNAGDLKKADADVEARLERANDDKRGLERQLHTAYDSLDLKTKELQTVSDAVDQQRHAMEMQQRELQDMALERENLQHSVEELALFQTKYYASLRENETVGERMNQLSAAISEANHALLVTKQELDDAKLNLEASQRESRSKDWKLKETEQRLQEVFELKDHLTAKNELAQQQIDSWKSQSVLLQKELDRALASETESKVSQHELSRTASRDNQSQREESEMEFWRNEAKFAAKVEDDVGKMSAALKAAFEKIVAHETGPLVNAPAATIKALSSGTPGAAKVHPSVFSHFLSSFKSLNKEVLSPQVIQVLQLILTFTQQHLDVIDQKVEMITSQYATRIFKQQQLVSYIRSSLVFEPEEEDESNVRDSTANDVCLDATFAAVTSIPDQKVELMEEARSHDGGDQAAAGKPSNDFVHSPARDTILDLSNIEAVNSPFQDNSALTFSMEGDAEDILFENPSMPKRNKKSELQKTPPSEDAQKQVFRDPVDLGTKELGSLQNTISSLLQDFSHHRTTLRIFVEQQQSCLKQIGSETSSKESGFSSLVKERNALLSDLTKSQREINECKEQIRTSVLDLEASERTKERLANENSANQQRIATLRKDMVDMEHRLLGTNRSSSFNRGRERPTSRTNSFQERLEASINEQLSSDSNSDYPQLRSELTDASRSLEAHKSEINRLQKALRETEDAHSNLKLSFVSSNNKLAAATEMTEKHTIIEAELKESKQREAQLRDEVARLVLQVQDLTKAVSAHEGLEKRLMQAEKDYVALNQQYEASCNLLESTEEDKTALKAKVDASVAERKRLQDELDRKLATSEESRIQLMQEAGEMRTRISSLENEVLQVDTQKTASAQKAESEVSKLKEKASEAVFSQQNLAQEVSKREQELLSLQESYDELKRSYVTCNEKLAGASEQLEKQAALVAEKESLEQSAKKNAAQMQGQLAEAASETASRQQQLQEEIRGLNHELQSLSDSHDQLKLNFVACNEKLADAREQLESKEALAAEKEDIELTLQHAKVELESATKKLEMSRESQNATLEEKKLLVEELEHAQHKARRIEEKLDTAQDEKKGLEDRLGKTQAEFAESEYRLKEKDLALKDSRQESVMLRSEVADIRKAKDSCLSDIEYLQASLEQSEEALENLKVSYVECNNKLAEKSSENEAMAQQLSDSQDALDLLDQEIFSLKQDHANLLQNFQLSANTEEQLNEEIESTKAKQEEASQKLVRAEESEATLNGKLTTLRGRLGETMEKLRVSENAEKQLRKEIDAANREREELHAGLSSAERRLHDYNCTEEDLNQEIAELKSERESLLEELREREQKAEQQTLEHSAMRESIEATREQLDEITTEYGNDLNSVRLKLTETLDECQDLREKLAEINQRSAAYEAEINALVSEKTELEDSHEKLQVAFVSCNDKLANLLEHNSHNESLIGELKAGCEAAEGLTEVTEQRLLDCQNELENIKGEREQLALELENGKEQLEVAAKEYADYKASQEEREAGITQEIEELRADKIESLRATQEELMAFGQELQGLRKDVVQYLASITRDNTSNQAVDNGHADAMAELRQLKLSIPTLCDAAAILQNKLKAAGKRSNQLEEEVELLRAVESDLRITLQNEKVISDELAAQLQEARAQVDYSSSKVTRLHDALREAQASETDERRKAIWTETAREEARLRYESELELKTEFGDEAEARLNEMESRTMTLSSKLVEAEDELTLCKSHLSAVLEDVEAKEQTIAEVESQRETWETRCFKLRVYMRKLTAKCEEWETCYGQQSKLLEAQHHKYIALKSVKTRDTGTSVRYSPPQPRNEPLGRQSNGSPRSILDVHEDPELEQLGQIAMELQDLTWSS